MRAGGEQLFPWASGAWVPGVLYDGVRRHLCGAGVNHSDFSLINPDNVSLLNQVRTKMVHFAWDNPDEDLTGYFQRFLELTAVKDKRKRQVYVLTNYGSSHEQDLYRVETLRDMGFSPYVMVYDRPSAPKITRQLQRWVNSKRIFYTVKDFADYAAGRKEAV